MLGKNILVIILKIRAMAEATPDETLYKNSLHEGNKGNLQMITIILMSAMCLIQILL